MQDNANYSYISTVITPDSNTHYIKDAEARAAITGLETSKQDKIDSSHKLPASSIDGLATVATSGSYNDLTNKPNIPEGVEVDTAMSGTSTNPVQNKVIHDALKSGSDFKLMRYRGWGSSIPTTSVVYGDLAIKTVNNNPQIYICNGVSGNNVQWEIATPEVDTAMSDSSYSPVQNRVIKAYVDDKISGLGSVLNYKGTKTSEQAIKAITSAKAGDVWINTADNSEWVCKQDISVATASAWEKFGPTIDLSGYALISSLGGFAYINEFTPEGSVVIDPYTPAGSISINSYTPAGSISMNNYTPAGTISVGTGTANYTPAGSITINSITPSGSISVGSGTANYTPGGSITVNSYTPEGTISTPTITVTPSTTTVNSITAVGTLPTWSASVANETLSFSFSQGTLPTKGANTTVATGIQSATSTQPTFTGTAKAPTGSFSGTGVELKFTGTAVTPTGSFSGTGKELKFTGTAAKPTGSFSGTAATLTGSFTGTQATLTGTFYGDTTGILPPLTSSDTQPTYP